MAAEMLEEMLRMAQDDDDDLLDGLEADVAPTAGPRGGESVRGQQEGGADGSPDAVQNSPINPNSRPSASNPNQARTVADSPARAVRLETSIPGAVQKRKAGGVEQLEKSTKKASKKSKKDKGKEIVVTVVPLGEQFLKQS